MDWFIAKMLQTAIFIQKLMLQTQMQIVRGEIFSQQCIISLLIFPDTRVR
jgi:hypothetical protein